MFVVFRVARCQRRCSLVPPGATSKLIVMSGGHLTSEFQTLPGAWRRCVSIMCVLLRVAACWLAGQFAQVLSGQCAVHVISPSSSQFLQHAFILSLKTCAQIQTKSGTPATFYPKRAMCVADDHIINYDKIMISLALCTMSGGNLPHCLLGMSEFIAR